MGLIANGKVVLSVYSSDGRVRLDVFESVKELIQHHIVGHSIHGSWGSQEQLDALRETKALLDRTTLEVEREVAALTPDELSSAGE